MTAPKPLTEGTPGSNEELTRGAAAGTPAVEARGLRRTFGELVANDDVDFTVRPGEIHALLGENGAGKTTLGTMLAGLLKPDRGEILAGGEPVAFGSPRDALRHGIGMVQQHSVLVPGLTVAENLVLGTESSWNPRLRHRAVERWAAELCERFGAGLDVSAPLATLSIDEVQQVEILRLLGRDVRVLILDEPTAVLARAHAERLFEALRGLRERGCSVVIVTHKLSEVIELADRATVLRHGRVVARLDRPEFNEDALASAVVGTELAEFGHEPAAIGVSEDMPRHGGAGDVVLAIEDLVVDGERSAGAVDRLSLQVRAGEVLGLAGVEGNGQAELIEALSGVRGVSSGTVRIGDRTLTQLDPRTLDRLGVAVVSSERRRWDVVQDLSIEENILLSELADPASDFSRWGFLRRSKMDAAVAERIKAFDVRPADPSRSVATLSGGNQQRVVLGRELAHRPRLLIAAYPTHGLDVAAVRFVHRTLLKLRDEATAVLVVSADRDELFALSDRVAVLYRGRIGYEAEREKADMRQFSRAMVGLGEGAKA